MSFPVAVADKLKVVCMCGLNNQLGLNVIYFRVATIVGTPATDDQVASTLAGIVHNEYKQLLSTPAEFIGISAQIVLPTLRPSVQDFSQRGPGTAGAESLPTQVCGIITKVGAAGGRGRKGRVYVPFPAEDDNSAGAHPTATYKARLDVLAADLLTSNLVITSGGNVTTLVQIIFDPARPALVQDITSSVSHQKWASQRRRGDYGRLNPIP